MEQSFWQTRWDEGRIGFHQDHINAHLQDFARQVFDQAERVLVPLCGKSSDLLWLCDAGYEVQGVEFVEQAVQAFFAENQLDHRQQGPLWNSLDPALPVSILCGDMLAADLGAMLAPFQAVYDRAALVALPAELRQQYADQLTQLARKGTQMLLVSRDHDMGSGPPFAVPVEEVRTLYADAWDLQVLRTVDRSAEASSLRERGATSVVDTIWCLQRR